MMYTVECDGLVAYGGLRNVGDPDLLRVEHLDVERTAADVNVRISHGHHVLTYKHTHAR